MSAKISEKLVSIIVPVFNSEKYLEECVDSLINQKYKNIEIILIDDGSKDSSKYICENYAKKDKRIVFISKKNSGVSQTRNLGIKRAKGHFIVFVDSDDIVNCDYISILVKNFQLGSLVVCKYKVFENEAPKVFINNQKISIIDDSDYIELYNFKLLNTPCCKLFVKSIIEKYNIKFDENLSMGEDLLFNFEYFKFIKQVKIVDSELYYYRAHISKSLTTNYSETAQDIQLMLADKISEYFSATSNLKTLNKIRMERIITIVENEYKNYEIPFLKRYLNARKKLNNKEIKRRIEKYKISFNKTDVFLLKNNMFILYKIKNKIERIFNKSNT